ncbi:hypothetical protein ACFLXQ_06755, partial [Chloroflexota bacterium]
MSSSSTKPSIRYATRLKSDSLGTLQTEATMQAGGGSQTGYNRWGDYSSLNVDPADDCTFWYTTEYYSSNSSASWKTRIGSFKLSECAGVSLSNQVSDGTPDPGQTITYTIKVANNYGFDLTNAVISNTIPAGISFVGPIELDPSGAGIAGTNPPTLVSSLTVTSGENITVTF